ncbi:hypothetical protein ACH4Y0_38135 [Streptomyces sp. NPDC020707]|uniref:hypothetical protein n=1 Tax=Streptomyces sp. NPDC020707 TaxID=3365084 RepID=UPI00379F7FEB
MRTPDREVDGLLVHTSEPVPDRADGQVLIGHQRDLIYAAPAGGLAGTGAGSGARTGRQR